MTRPTARVLALLEILQSGGIRTVGDLAARLEVDERTVRRYVGHLIDLDIPVRSVRGRHGGYRLGPGFRMPPLMFTDDEALAVLLGMAAGRRGGIVPTSATAADSAAAKIRRVLPEAMSHRLDAVLETTEFAKDEIAAEPAASGLLILLAEAVRDRRPVEIEYRKSDGGRSRRVVHPYGTVSHAGHWYLPALDPAVDDLRTFRLDRITDARLLPGTVPQPLGFDPVETVLSSIATAPHRHDVVMRVKGTAAEVRKMLPLGLPAIADISNSPGWLRVELRVEQLGWVPAVLAGMKLPFVLEGPAELRDGLRALARLLDAAADPG